MTDRYIIELERGCYSAPWSGDPGRTTLKCNAKFFGKKGAIARLAHDRKFRPFINAKIIKVQGDNMKIYDRQEKLLAETNKKIGLYDIIKIGDVLYSVCIKSHNITVEPFTFNSDIDSSIVSNKATCPYCNAQHSNITGYGEYRCDVCGSDFGYEKVITVEYYTRPFKRNDKVVEL
ncbi:MAG: hypothetical protein WBB27_10060 [Maribacter sp.]